MECLERMSDEEIRLLQQELELARIEVMSALARYDKLLEECLKASSEGKATK